MTTYETLNILLQIPMPIVVSIGIWRMVKANNDRSEVGEETRDALKISVDALRELLEERKQESR